MPGKTGILYFFFITSLFSAGVDRYNLTIWGIPCGTVTWESSVPGEISFTTASVGLIDIFWPFKNSYTTTYDSVSYRVLSSGKTIDQKNIKQSLSSSWETELKSYVYDTGDMISSTEKRLNIFTVMALSTRSDPEEIDTKKMPMILEGELYQVRLIYAGLDTLKFNRKTYYTDHYRIDFLVEKGGRKVLDQTDFFHEYLVHKQAVKQLWVSREEKGKVIQAAVTLNGITIFGRLNE